MTEISYERLVEKALLHVVHDALLSAQKNGLDGNHFYITFQTPRDDVVLSDRLKAAYPKEITIVLQHEYSDLEVSDDAFSVVLSFGNIPEKSLSRSRPLSGSPILSRSSPFHSLPNRLNLKKRKKRNTNPNPIRKTSSV